MILNANGSSVNGHDHIEFTTFANKKVTDGRVDSRALADLREMFEHPPVRGDIESLPLISFARRPGGTRKAGTPVEAVTALTLDYDAGRVPFDEAVRLLHERGIQAFAHTTRRHTPGRPRFRIVAPLCAPVSPQQYVDLVSLANGALGGILAPESWEVSRGYFYGQVEGVEYRFASVEGEPLDLIDLCGADWEPIGKPAPKAKEPAPSAPVPPADEAIEMQAKLAGVDDQTIDDLHGAVLRLDRGRLEELHGSESKAWIQLGYAFASLRDTEQGDDALRLWRRASKRLWPASYDSEEIEERWPDLDPGSITYKSVFAWAKQVAGEPTPAVAPVGDRRVQYSLNQVPYDEFVLDGFLPTGTTTIAGGHGAGKSSNLIPLAAAVAHLIESPLRPFLRRKVVWITEYPRQVFKTLYGLLKCAPGAASQSEFEEWFHVVTAERSSAAKLGAFVEEQVRSHIVPGPNGYEVYPLIMLDTANANIDVEHESDNSGIGKAISAVRRAIGYDRGACWIVTHTPGGQRNAGVDGLTARGGTAWEADVDAVAYLADEQGKRFMKLGKRRFEAAFDVIEFDSDTGLELVQTPWGETQEVHYRYGSATKADMGAVEEARQTKKDGEGGFLRALEEAIEEMAGGSDQPLNWKLVVDRAAAKAGRRPRDNFTRERSRLKERGAIDFDGIAIKRIEQKIADSML